jgi:hypothetical protein
MVRDTFAANSGSVLKRGAAHDGLAIERYLEVWTALNVRIVGKDQDRAGNVSWSRNVVVFQVFLYGRSIQYWLTGKHNHNIAAFIRRLFEIGISLVLGSDAIGK